MYQDFRTNHCSANSKNVDGNWDFSTQIVQTSLEGIQTEQLCTDIYVKQYFYTVLLRSKYINSIIINSILEITQDI